MVAFKTFKLAFSKSELEGDITIASVSEFPSSSDSLVESGTEREIGCE